MFPEFSRFVLHKIYLVIMSNSEIKSSLLSGGPTFFTPPLSLHPLLPSLDMILPDNTVNSLA